MVFGSIDLLPNLGVILDELSPPRFHTGDDVSLMTERAFPGQRGGFVKPAADADERDLGSYQADLAVGAFLRFQIHQGFGHQQNSRLSLHYFSNQILHDGPLSGLKIRDGRESVEDYRARFC
jgi:hypothetical protein